MLIKLPLSPAVNAKKIRKIPTAFVKNKYPLGLEFENVVFRDGDNFCKFQEESLSKVCFFQKVLMFLSYLQTDEHFTNS